MYKPSLLLICCALIVPTSAQSRKDVGSNCFAEAIDCFHNIQKEARSKTWWFHGETETTKEGITADLAAFEKAGLGGVVYYDQSHGKAENALDAFSDEWWDMFRFAASEAQGCGLSFEVHISNGYVAGSALISDEHSMKRLASTELPVEGGRYFEGKLEPPTNKFSYYRDVAVLAFPAKAGIGISSSNQTVKLSSNRPEIDVNKLFDPQWDKLTNIPVHDPGKPVYIQLEFDAAFTARCITYEVKPKGKATSSATNVPAPAQETFIGTGYRILPNLGQLEVSQDGLHFSKVCNLKPIYRAHESWQQKTISFAAVQGKYYRLNLHDWWETDKKPEDMQIGKLVLHSAAKMDQWEEKAGFYSEYIEQDQTPDYSDQEAIDYTSVINLSDKMLPDGTLQWDVPAGRWMVLRFAQVSTGRNTKHGRKNLIGRECDKLSVQAAEFHWNSYVQVIIDSLEAAHIHHLSGVAMDSHEAGAQNWTEHFIEEFAARQGYDPTLYLPAMMGYIVQDVKTSRAFLFDIRRNIADMMADNYYGTFERLCRENDLEFTAQAIGNALCIVGDPIQAKSKVSKPQGEFWVIHPDGNYDIKESSSAAHLYNKTIASAEAFTDAKYHHSPAYLKSLADCAYAYGINEFVVCASPFQPWLDKIPGSTGGGRHYAINRNNTWWPYSRDFWDYQARNTGLLRKGKSSIQLCVYLGDNAPVKILTHRLPDIPGGYDFDAFTADALHTRMSAQEDKIRLSDCLEYQMMILPAGSHISYAALEKIAHMVQKGIRIYGQKPNLSASSIDCDKAEAYQKLADQVWGAKPNAQGYHQYGKGRVYWGLPLHEALTKAKIEPDISLQKGDTKEHRIYFTHRSLADAELYFLYNHKDTAEDNLFSFAASGKYAQVWNTVTGQRFSLPIHSQDGKSVSIALYMAARESYFIALTDHYEELPPVTWSKPGGSLLRLKEDWQVYFDPSLGGPGTVVFDTLHDWTKNKNPDIKHYSGTAVYQRQFDIRPSEQRVFIELDNADFPAKIYINQKEVGSLWCSPWQLEITDYLQPGKNSLEIHVCNSLVNRMIQDASLPEAQGITFSYPPIMQAGDSLVSSGLQQVRIIGRF